MAETPPLRGRVGLTRILKLLNNVKRFWILSEELEYGLFICANCNVDEEKMEVEGFSEVSMTSAIGWRGRRQQVGRRVFLRRLQRDGVFLWEGVVVAQSCTQQGGHMIMTVTEHNLYIKPDRNQEWCVCFLFLAFVRIYNFHNVSSLHFLIFRLPYFWQPLFVPISPANYVIPPPSAGCTLTVRVFIRQPVVLVAVDFKARVQSVALLLPRVTVDVFALVGVAHPELIWRPQAVAASVGWPERGCKAEGICVIEKV